MKNKIQIALGLVAAILILIGACQYEEFNLLKVRAMAVKLFATWYRTILLQS